MTSILSLRVLKFVLSAVVLGVAGWLASTALNFKYVINQSPAEPQFFKDHKTDIVNELSVDYPECLKVPSKLFCILASDRQISVIDKGNVDTDIGAVSSTRRTKRRHPMNSLVSDFTTVASESDVEVILIEPSILYCMLRKQLKVLLLRRRHEMGPLLGSSTIVNFAVMQGDSDRLRKLQPAFEKYGFKYYEVLTDDEGGSTGGQHAVNATTTTTTTHYFLIRHRILVHVIVFFERGDFLWHAKVPSLPEELRELVHPNDLLFAKENAAYERFSGVAVPDIPDQARLVIPDHPAYFLYQISMSRFLNCELRENTNKPSVKNLENSIKSALRELGHQLRPMLVTLFLFKSTLLSWFQSCGTSDISEGLQYGTWSVDEESVSRIVDVFKKSDRLKFSGALGQPEDSLVLRMKFQTTDVQVHFLYRDSKANSYHAADHRPSEGFYIRRRYPRFTICSAELSVYLVRVPCETKAVLTADYGPSL